MCYSISFFRGSVLARTLPAYSVFPTYAYIQPNRDAPTRSPGKSKYEKLVPSLRGSGGASFLLSAVVERGISSVDFESYAGKTVAMDYSNLAPQVDKEFVQAYIELHLARYGITVAKEAADADYVIKASSSVLATDVDKFLLGIPSLPVPIPYMNLSVVIPEIPIFMRIKRSAWGRFFFNIVDAKTNKPVQIVDGAKSESSYNNWVVCFIPFKSHDLPLGDDNPERTHFIWFFED